MDDLFGDVPQPARSAPAEGERKPLTVDDVRQQMLDLIEAVRSANVMPFDPAELKRHKAMFPIMAQWLEPDEGQQLVFEFESEIQRLLAA